MAVQVRKLDERQMRVHRVLAMVEDVLNLKTCALGVERALQEGDLPDVRSTYLLFPSHRPRSCHLKRRSQLSWI
jgi:hypothetical protein